MEQQRLLTIIGTRPEAIKLAPVVMELRRRPRQCAVSVCVTGQHREMLDHVLELFGIKPDFDLDIMAPKQTLSQITVRAIEGLDGLLAKTRPDMVLVQGDTTTALCGALAAYYHRVRIGHVEAGLRTGNKYAPFPEEGNRRLLSHLADIHFAPTEYARQALLAEGIRPEVIYITGNTVIDALLWVRDYVRESAPALPKGILEAIVGRDAILVTGHRRESFGAGFESICHAIRDVADARKNVVFIYPVHLNPNVREPVNRILGNHERILLTEPLSYAPFVWLMDKVSIVLTDSGGVQEEAPSLGKPVLVMRETTERPEGIVAGNARLVGVDRSRIVGALLALLSDPSERERMSGAKNPYGDGHAASKIADVIAGTSS